MENIVRRYSILFLSAFFLAASDARAASVITVDFATFLTGLAGEPVVIGNASFTSELGRLRISPQGGVNGLVDGSNGDISVRFAVPVGSVSVTMHDGGGDVDAFRVSAFDSSTDALIPVTDSPVFGGNDPGLDSFTLAVAGPNIGRIIIDAANSGVLPGLPRALAGGLVLTSLTTASGIGVDTLSTTENQVSNGGAFESVGRPTLGADRLTDLLVYKRQSFGPMGFANGLIIVQRLGLGGLPIGSAVQLSDGTTDDRLPGTSGPRIAFTARDSVSSSTGSIKVFDLSTGRLQTFISSADMVMEARIHDSALVWIEGCFGATKVMYYDLGWPSTAAPMVLAGPTPTVRQLEIGSGHISGPRVWVSGMSSPLLAQIPRSSQGALQPR